MDDKIKVVITRGELGLLYEALCELMDKDAGKVIERNNLKRNQMITLQDKINRLALSY